MIVAHLRLKVQRSPDNTQDDEKAEVETLAVALNDRELGHLLMGGNAHIDLGKVFAMRPDLAGQFRKSSSPGVTGETREPTHITLMTESTLRKYQTDALAKEVAPRARPGETRPSTGSSAPSRWWSDPTSVSPTDGDIP